jgi:hypothetical protein
MKNFLNKSRIVVALLLIIITLVLSLGKYSVKDYYYKIISMVDTADEAFLFLMILNTITLLSLFIVAIWIAVNNKPSKI